MKKIVVYLFVAAALVSATSGLVWPALSPEKAFTLDQVVPDDVFLFVGHRNDPKRAFLDQYWSEVFDAAKASGIQEDVVDLFTTLIGTNNKELFQQMQRLKEKALELMAGLDLKAFAEAKEFVFAEKFTPPLQMQDGAPFMMPDMLWLLRVDQKAAAQNYEGLVAILQAIVDEINQAAGGQVLTVERSQRGKTLITQVNLFAKVPDAPQLPLSLALHDDILMGSLRETLFNDTVSLLEGDSKVKALADDPRYRSAFASLPAAEDSKVFFSMQQIVRPLRPFFEIILNKIGESGDVTINRGMNDEANKLNAKAMVAYMQGDYAGALELVRQAHEMAPESSIILYNLACFNARLGNRAEALDWLGKAVEAGFYSPTKIAGDSDLSSLHGDPAFEAALARAAELAQLHSAPDVIINSTHEGEVLTLRNQVQQAYKKKDYALALQLAEQALAIAPTDSEVLYDIAYLHALLGHEKEALDYLKQAVAAGFYSYRHIMSDPDLESLHGNPRFQAAVDEARKGAATLAAGRRGSWMAAAERIMDRIVNSMGVIDYSATVEYTDGYSTHTEEICKLSDDAKDRPIYSLFTATQFKDFSQFLPKETDSFTLSGGLNPEALYDFILDSIRLAGDAGDEIIAKWEGIQKQLGFDLRKDLLGWIEGESIKVTLKKDKGSVLLFKVNDEEAARKMVSGAIAFLSEKLTQVISENPKMAPLAMLSVRTSPIDRDDLKGFQNIYFSMSPKPAVWGVADGYLVFGSSADAVALCLETAKGAHPNIKENQAAMSQLLVPKGPFVELSLDDLSGQGQEMSAGLGMASMVLGMMGSFIPEPEVQPILAKFSSILGKLSPVVLKIDFYKSKSSLTTFDGKAWHTSAVTHYLSPEERAKAEQENEEE